MLILVNNGFAVQDDGTVQRPAVISASQVNRVIVIRICCKILGFKNPG